MNVTLTPIRGATDTKASKVWALPKVPISTKGTDYAHHSNMGLVWLKFAVATLPLLIMVLRVTFISDRSLSKYYTVLHCAYHVIKKIPTHLLQNIITFVHCTAVVFLQPLKVHPYGNVSKLHVGLFWLDK